MKNRRYYINYQTGATQEGYFESVAFQYPEQWAEVTFKEYQMFKAPDEQVKSIFASQWNTIAEDVKAGRVKAYTLWDGEERLRLSRQRIETGKTVFDYLTEDEEIESGEIQLEPDDVITLEWLDPLTPAKRGEYEALRESITLYEAMKEGVGVRIGDLEAEIARMNIGLKLGQTELDKVRNENARLQHELDAAKADAADLWAFYEMIFSLDYQNEALELLKEDIPLNQETAEDIQAVKTWADFSVLCDTLHETYEARQALAAKEAE